MIRKKSGALIMRVYQEMFVDYALVLNAKLEVIIYSEESELLRLST